MSYNKFLPFDKVVYIGSKFRSELGGQLGIIDAKVDRSENTYCVNYGENSYVLHASLLKYWQVNSRDEHMRAEQEIYRRRRRPDEDQ